jgi:hypothetical protein
MNRSNFLQQFFEPSENQAANDLAPYTQRLSKMLNIYYAELLLQVHGTPSKNLLVLPLIKRLIYC